MGHYLRGSPGLELEDVWRVWVLCLQLEAGQALGAGRFAAHSGVHVQVSREAHVIVSLQAKHIKTGEERVIKAVKKSRTALPLDEIEQEILIMRPEIRRFSPCRFLKQCQAN